MRTEVTMPNLGYDMHQGTIMQWLKGVGDRVERGEPIAEIETDKATMEMEALVTGTLVEIVSPAGSEVDVGVTIAYVEPEVRA
jgi:pyruvate dehydrogenase E2 component (dihydrolipoamide acetyltransferase)